MKIGLIYCAYNAEETIHDSLKAWIQARQEKLLGHEFIISAVSIPFKEYKYAEIKEDDTIPILTSYRSFNHIQYYNTRPKYITEAEVRNIALRPLLEVEKCDIIILIDADEIYSIENIENILKFIELEKFISWFNFSFKNYVFTDKQYLKTPFTPPRLFKVKTNGYELKEFFWDNDITYKTIISENNTFVEKKISYKELPSKIIPSKIASIKHLTWMDSEKSKRKIAYQMAHFGGICSYAWDYANNKLIFNKDYYSNLGQDLPEVITEI